MFSKRSRGTTNPLTLLLILKNWEQFSVVCFPVWAFVCELFSQIYWCVFIGNQFAFYLSPVLIVLHRSHIVHQDLLVLTDNGVYIEPDKQQQHSTPVLNMSFCWRFQGDSRESTIRQQHSPPPTQYGIKLHVIHRELSPSHCRGANKSSPASVSHSTL